MAQSAVRTSFILNQHQHQQQQPLFRQPLSTAAKPRSSLAAPSPPSPRKFLVSAPATTIPASSSTEREPPMMSFSPSSSSTPTPTATPTPSVASSSSTAATSIHPTDEAEEPWVADMRLEHEGELLQLYKDLGESGDLGPQAVQGYLTKVQLAEQKFQLKIEVRREMEVEMEKKRLEREKQHMAEILENPSPDFVERQRIELERIAMKRDAEEKKREAEERRKQEREKIYFIPEPDNEEMGQGKGKAPVVEPSIERQRASLESSDSTHDSDSDSGTGSASSHPSSSTAPTSAHPSPTSNRSYSTVPSAVFQQQPSLTSQRMSVNYGHNSHPSDSLTFGGSSTGPAPRKMFQSSLLVPMSESETENEGDDESPSPTPMLPRAQTLHTRTSYATLNPTNPSLTSMRDTPASGMYGGTSTASDVAQARRASMLPSTGQGTGSWPPRNRSPPSSTITPPAPNPAPAPVTSSTTGPKKLNSASGSYSGLPPASHSAPSLNRKVSAASMQSQGESLAEKMRREHLASEARFKSSQERRPSLTSMSTSPQPTSSSASSVVGATGTATGTKPSPPPRSSTYPQPSAQVHPTPTPPPTTYTNARTSTPTSMSSSAGAGAGVGAGVSGAARKPSGPNPSFRAPSTGTSTGARSATGTYGSSTTSTSASGVPPRSSSTSTAGAAPRAGSSSTSGPSASSTSSGPKKQHEYTDDDYARAQEEEERFRARRLASSISSSSSSTPPSIKGKISTAYNTYEKRWSNTIPALSAIRWEDIPWPVLEPHKVLDVEGLKVMEIASFLLSPWHSEGRSRKDRIKGELLRWHPDRFEGKYLERVRFGGVSLGGKTREEKDAEEREKVKKGVGEVARALSELLRMDLGGGFAD